MKQIPLAKDFSIPADYATQKGAILGKSGSGKSYCGSKLSEGLLDNEIQTVIIDPVGVWYGLRIAADGKGKGFPITIFGGQHGDIPIEKSSGALVASVIVQKGISAIVDTSEFRTEEAIVFITDFAKQLYHLKKKYRSAIHLIFDEAQWCMPQFTKYKNEKEMLGAMEDICKKGRNFGIGYTLISQQPQAVNKTCLNQVEVMMVFQMAGPHELKAVNEWWKYHNLMDTNTDEPYIRRIPTLKNGECFLFSPNWLLDFRHLKISAKKTFDTSQTPKVGVKFNQAKQLAPVDLEKVVKDFQAIIDKKNNDDPTFLRNKISDLEFQLRVADIKPESSASDEQIVEMQSQIGYYRNEVVSWKEFYKNKIHPALENVSLLEKTIMITDEEVKQVQKSASTMVNSIYQPTSETRNHPPLSEMAKKTHSPREIKSLKSAPVATRLTSRHEGKNVDGIPLDKCARAILNVVAQFGEATRSKISILTGYRQSGGFRNSLSNLKKAGLIEYAGKNVTVTVEGRCAQPISPLPTGAQLRQFWIDKLDKCSGAIFEFLLRPSIGSYLIAELPQAVGYNASGGFRNALSKLNILGLIERQEGKIRVKDKSDFM